jgi:hypothetical protein
MCGMKCKTTYHQSHNKATNTNDSQSSDFNNCSDIGSNLRSSQPLKPSIYL